MQEKGDSGHQIKVVHGARAWESIDPDTSRIWWDEVGVHQNLTHAVHPDPVSGHTAGIKKRSVCERLLLVKSMGKCMSTRISPWLYIENGSRKPARLPNTARMKPTVHIG